MKQSQRVLLATAVFLSAAIFGGCGKAEHSSDGATAMVQTLPAASETIGQILEQAPNEKITKTVSYGESTYAEYFSYLYDLDLTLVSDGAIAYAAAGGYADEISVLYVADDDNLRTVKTALKARIDRRLNDFRGYVPAEIPKLEAASVYESGNCLVLMICDNQKQVEAAAEQILSENRGTNE